MKYMFAGCTGLTSLDLGYNFGTSQVTDMSYMFYNCSNLSSLDLSQFNTSNVMNSCSSLLSYGFTLGDGWHTSKVTDMSYMFSGCSNLSSLDLSQFNTSNVTNMNSMFQTCSLLKNIVFGLEWNTSKVTDMSSMFAHCACFSLDLSSWDTSSVTNMSSMFIGSYVFNLNVDGWDTSSVTNMYAMFEYCTSLPTLDLSSWDTSKVTNMSHMFWGCMYLKDLTFGEKWNTSKVVSMEYMFAECSALTELDLSKWDTSELVNMEAMFRGIGARNLDLSTFDTSKVQYMNYVFSSCPYLESITFGDKWNTSNATAMVQMFYNCSSLETLDLGDNFSIANVTNMSEIFSGCSNLETIDSITLGSNNVVSSFANLFSGLTQLKNVTINTPAGGAKFSNLSTMENMFKDCSSLTSVNLGNWRLPNLTNTSAMFSGCTNLTDIDLIWTGINAAEGNYSINDMFSNVPDTATLESGSDNSVMLNAIRAAFPGSVTQDGAQWTAPANQLITETTPAEVPEATPEETPNEAPQTPEETPDDPQSNSSETPEDSQLTPNETPEVSQPTQDETPEVSQPTQDETPEVSQPAQDETPEVSQPAQDEAPQTPDTAEDAAANATPPQNTEATEPSDEGTEPTDEPSVMPLSTTETALARSATTYASGEESVYVHPEMVSEFDTITYKVTVKYVGDVGVKSGRITLNFPIPEDIGQFQGTADSGYADAGWNISTTQIDYSGSPTGYKGGRVVEEPTVKEVGSGQYALQGVFEGLYTGTEVTVSIITTVQGKQDEDYNEAGYAFWDGTAYVSDSAGTSASQTVRLWNLKGGGEDPEPPTTTSYQLRYAFTGDVPSDAELPQTTVVDSGKQVTAETEPSTSLDGYTFDGWYRSDNGTKVTPGTEFSMPAANLTLTGKWTLGDAHIQKITVKYEYTNNNDGAHIPDGAPVLPEEQTVKVGQTHYIQKIDQDANYHKFGGWEPTLSVNGQDVPLTKQPDGTYQSNDKAYTIDVAGGTLSTDQFRDKNNVVVTFSGAWTPYKGTIRFDANGGEGDMDDMTNVTWDTTKTLTKNAFTYPYDGYQFIGWATTPAGAVFKTDQQTAEGLIDEDSKTVTLYAVWKRAAYGVGYRE